MPDARVLIVGAGPTGLVLALWLTRQGISIRLVERNSEPGRASRAMAVHARTLEFYGQLGFAGEVVERGIRINAIHLREGQREVAYFKLGDLGDGLSPFPFVLSLPQDEHERFLIEQLKAEGVEVEWETELVSFSDRGDHVLATLRRKSVEESCEVEYMCGCDGAHSTVRQGLGLKFPGGTYEQVFYVTDVEASGEVANRNFNACLGENAFCAVFPIRTSGMNRVIGIVPEELRENASSITFEDIRQNVRELIGLEVNHVNWFSTYQVHHRVAEAFRRGRVFICGDAGHIHSPAGGQGMNTGIGDAVNLAWKLATVLQNRADNSLLDTYEPERMAFARLLVETTDQAFKAIAGKNIGSQMFRTLLVPHLAPFLLGFSRVRKAAFRLLSQIRINYRDSELSSGSAGEVGGGERLPWVEDLDNFASLKTLDWQIHVYGVAGKPLRSFATAHNLALQEFAWTPNAEEIGFARDALYLVRPDGYVALASVGQNVDELEEFIDRFKIVAR